MKNPAIQQAETQRSSPVSNRRKNWENICVQHFQSPAGEANCLYDRKHTLSLGLSPRPTPLLLVRDKTYTGLYGKGDMAITPL